MIGDKLVYQKYLELATLFPKDRTNRKSDLDNLLEVKTSFCLYSIPRNGATTLLMEYCQEAGASYLDCYDLASNPTIENLNKKIGLKDSPLVLDEARSLFYLFKDYNLMDYLLKLSQSRQLGLRFHPSCENYASDFERNGFEIIRLGKIPYSEFKEIFDSCFDGTSFSVPEKFVLFGYENYDSLAISVNFVADAFRMLNENTEVELKETDVAKIVDRRLSQISSKK